MTDHWLFSWEILEAFLICSFIIAIAIFLKVRSIKKTKQSLLDKKKATNFCEICQDSKAPLGVLHYTGFEGYFLNAYTEHFISLVLCQQCAPEVVKDSRSLALKTFWKSLQGPIGLMTTYINTKSALKQHEKEVAEAYNQNFFKGKNAPANSSI